MQNELVSVITPCYNAEKYIAQTIESVLNQTYSNWEMIIVDDCSKDNSAEVIKQYCEKDSRIKYFKTDKPSGSPATPRNIAIEKAQGRFIAFLDADDIWFEDKLEKQLPYFEQENVAVVFSDYEKVDEQGNRSNRVVRAPQIVSYNDLLESNYIGNLTGVYDTQKVGKVYHINIYHEDYVLWLSILKKDFIARNIQEVEALYRVCQSGVSHNKFKVITWQWNILRNIEKLSFVKAVYCLLRYAIKGFTKFSK